MTARRTIFWLGLAVAVALAGEAAAERFAAQAALDTNSLPTSIGASSDLGAGVAAPLVVDPAPQLARPQNRRAFEARGNPLWAIPVKTLTATRERPIFLPSRRPPAPAVAGPPPPEPVRAPPPPAEPDRPKLALVGAVAGNGEGIAVFVDQTTRGIVRLRTGENHQGWTLSSVKGREVTLEKARETVFLALPAPTDPVGPPGMVGMPGMVGGPAIAIPGSPAIPVGPGGKEPEL